MIPEKIEYSTKPITVADMLYASLAAKGDIEYMIMLIVARTNLTREEVLLLESEEAAAIIAKVAEALGIATVLQNLGKQLPDS